MIKAAEKELGKPLVLLMAPWSPPAFMKTNGEMNHGGELKPEYRELWADYFVKFIQEYKKRGIEISFTSIQNEPNATQTWDSCRYTTEQEADFALNYLGPALEKAGLLDEVKVLVWDHNKEVSYKRFKDIMEKDGADKWCSDLIQFTRKAAYERESIDTKSLKAKMPEVYESFKKVTKVAESITYKVL